jgi:hypothetical protein
MRFFKQTLTFSATDLVNFLGCRHSTYLDVLNLASPAPPAPDDPFLEAIPGKGFARMPRPDSGDLFFDMEGDPLFAGGLEYLDWWIRCSCRCRP